MMTTRYTLIREFLGFDIYQNAEGFLAIDRRTTKRLQGLTLDSVMTDIDEIMSDDKDNYEDDPNNE